VPPQGLHAWSAPDPSAAPVSTLTPSLDVQVVQSNGPWAQVLCSNGWTGWVDANALRPLGAAPFPPPAAQTPAAQDDGLLGLLGVVGSNPFLGALFVLLFGVAISQLLWPVLGFPASVISAPFADATCTDLDVDTGAMWLCSAKVGLLSCVGAIAVGLVMLIFIRPIQRGIQKLKRRLPQQSHFLVGPLLGTAAFTSMYAGIHSSTSNLHGWVDQRMFPAVIGLLGYLAPRLGRVMSDKAPQFFERRDRIPAAVRVLIAFAIPLAYAYITNNQSRVTDTARKEQTIVMLGLVMTFLMVLPKSGDLAGKAESFMARVPGGVR